MPMTFLEFRPQFNLLGLQTLSALHGVSGVQDERDQEQNK